jgi:Glycosyl transferases group 1
MASLRVLANLPLPQPEGFTLRHFGVYAEPANDLGFGLQGRQAAHHQAMNHQPQWQPRQERRSLKEILARIPVSEQPDILLMRSPEYLPLPAGLADFKGLKILIITDWNVSLRFLPALCGLFDVCFTDAAGAGLLRRTGVANVWPAALYGHDARALRDLHLRRDLDLSFCGNLNAGLHRERNRVLTRLLPLREKYRVLTSPTFGAAYVEVLSRSHLVFNHSVRGEANMRLYEAMACGAVPVIERGNVEAPLLFEEGRHYATYDPADPTVAIEALLGEPEKIMVMGREAQRAVQEHTQEKQLARMLHQALDLVGGPAGVSLGTGRGETQQLAAQQAAHTLRVLGTGYTLRESIEEMRSVTASDPIFRLRVFPGLLLSLLEKGGGQANRSGVDEAPMLLRWVEQLLADPDMPPFLAAWHRLALASAGGRAASVLAAADSLMAEATKAAAGSDPAPDIWYRHILAPADLAKPLNADLNALFRGRIENREDRGLAGFAMAFARWHKAQALLRLGRFGDALSEADLLPAGRYASLDVYALRAEIAWRQNASEELVSICRAWHEDNPLDVGVWESIVDKLIAAGQTGYLRSYLTTLIRLAEAYLRNGVPVALAKLAAQHGAA